MEKKSQLTLVSSVMVAVASLALEAEVVGKEDENYVLVTYEEERALQSEVANGVHGPVALEMVTRKGTSWGVRGYFKRICGFRVKWAQAQLGFMPVEPKNSALAQIMSAWTPGKPTIQLDKATEKKWLEECRSGMHGRFIRADSLMADKPREYLKKLGESHLGLILEFDAPKFGTRAAS